MYTNIPLSTVAIILGLLVFLTRLPGVVYPEAFRKFWLAIPRSKPAGYLLMGLAIGWCATVVYLTGFMDVSEWKSDQWWEAFIRSLLLLLQAGRPSVWIVFGVIYFLIVWLLDDFLAVRGLALLSLLVARVMLDAAFVVETRARLVMVVIAYLMVVAGMWFTIAPYRFRDLLGIVLANNRRCRWLCGAGAASGILLVMLGIWVY
jgi:hypothetical protein